MVDDDRYFLRPCRPRCGARVRPSDSDRKGRYCADNRTYEDRRVATEQMERTVRDEETEPEPADFKSQSIRSEKATVARSQSSVA